MKKRVLARFGMSFVALCSALSAMGGSYSFHRDRILGTSLDLTVVANDSAQAEAALAASLAEIERLSAIFNLYTPDSEISRLNAAGSAQVSPELFEVLVAAEKWRVATDGIFSARVGSILQAWRQARETDQLPDRPGLRVTSAKIADADVEFDKEKLWVKQGEEVVWATDGIAKGYIIDAAFTAAVAAAPEAEGLLLDIGGDLRADGVNSEGAPWRVGIAEMGTEADNESPRWAVSLGSGAVATSGHHARSFEIAGKEYSHILDTKSGWAKDSSHAATVVAHDAATADALATAFTAMSAVASIQLAETIEGVECLIQGQDGRRYTSSGWRDLELTLEDTVVSESGWPEEYQLEVDFEVPDLDVSKYRAPYVSIWITDAERKLVKSLLMLGDNPRWTEENYVWWRRYARKAPLLVDAISQPSRKPGRYVVVWDGSDDFGQQVEQGVYTLNVEASREHGDHTLAKIDLELFSKKFKLRQKAEGELGGIRVEYSKKAGRN